MADKYAWLGLIAFLVVIVTGFLAVYEAQSTAINDYCLDATGHANWTAEECNLTGYSDVWTCKPSGQPFGMTVCELK